MFYSMVGFELPKDTTRKCEISGVVATGIIGQRRVIALHRSTMAIMGSTKVNSDNSWKIQLNTTELNKIIAICIDDSGNYNADIYDRIDACAITFEADVQKWFNWFIDNRKYSRHKIPTDLKRINLSSNKALISQKDVKNNAYRFLIDTNYNKGHFVDSSGVAVPIGPGTANEKICEGSIVNNEFTIETIVGDGTASNSVIVCGLEQRFYPNNGVPLDFFSDSTALLHAPLINTIKCNGTSHTINPIDEKEDMYNFLGNNLTPLTGGPNAIQNKKIDFRITEDGSYSFSFFRTGPYGYGGKVLQMVGVFYLGFNASNYLQVQYNSTGLSSALTSLVTASPASAPSPSARDHYVVSLGPSGIRMFKNGVQVYTNSTPVVVKPYIGSIDGYKGTLILDDTSYSGSYYSFSIYNIRIFKREITSTVDVLALYNEGLILSSGNYFNVNSIYNFNNCLGRTLENFYKTSKNSKYETLKISNNRFVPGAVSTILIDQLNYNKYQKVLYVGKPYRKGVIGSDKTTRYTHENPIQLFRGAHSSAGGVYTVLQDAETPVVNGSHTIYLNFVSPMNISGFSWKAMTTTNVSFQNSVKGIRIYGSTTDDFTVDGFFIKNHVFKDQTESGQWSDFVMFPKAHMISSLKIEIQNIQNFTTGVYWSGEDLAFVVDEEVPPDAIKGRSIVIDIADNWGGTNMGIKHFCPRLKNQALYVENWSFYSTSEQSSGYKLKNACSLRKYTGGSVNYCWKSGENNATNQRIILVADKPFYMDDFNLINFHNNYAEYTTGVKNITIKITDDVITDTTYNAAVSNSRLLFSGEVKQMLNPEWAKERFGLKLQRKKSVEARSVVFDIANNYGDASFVAMRKIEFFLRGQLIPYEGTWTCGQTSYYNTNYYAVRAFNTGYLINDTYLYMSASGQPTNQRIYVKFDVIKEFDEIRVVNGSGPSHESYRGAKNVVVKVTLDSTTPSSSYNAAITDGVTLSTCVFGIDTVDYDYLDGRFHLPVLSKRNTKIYKARSVVFDIENTHNYSYPAIAIESIFFLMESNKIEPSNWSFFFSYKGNDTTESKLFSTSGLDLDLSVSSERFFCYNENKKLRLIVVFPETLELDRIINTLWRRNDYETGVCVRDVKVYTTLNVLTNSDCIYGQAIPNSTMIAEKALPRKRMPANTDVQRVVAYVPLLDYVFDGSDPHIILLIHPGTAGSSIFSDSSKYEQNLSTTVGSPVFTNTQFNLSSTSIDFRIGYLRSTRLGLYSLSDIPFKIKCFVYNLSLITDTTILSKWTISGNKRSYRLSIINGNLSLAYSTDGTNEVFLNSTAQIPLNTWTYIEVVRMYGTLVIKIGNSIDSTHNIGTAKFNPTHTPVCVGTHDDSLGNCFNGFIDELEFSVGHIFDLTQSIPLTAPSTAYPGFANDNFGNFVSMSFGQTSDTYKVFKSAAWRSIASRDPVVHGNVGDTDWYYINGSDVWSKTGLSPNDEYEALNKAVELSSLNRNTVQEINSLTSGNWELEFSGYLDIAITTIRENLTYSTIKDIHINGKKLWFSEAIKLRELTVADTVSSSKITWIMGRSNSVIEIYDIFRNSFKVYSRVVGQIPWEECTNNQPIPCVTVGMSAVGVSLEFMVEYIEAPVNLRQQPVGIRNDLNNTNVFGTLLELNIR